jgi:uncharacterized membrane protein
MFAIPQPLHPALIHFPIVLIFLGFGAAVLSLFTNRWNIRIWTVVLLVLAAIGTMAATWTGGEARHALGNLPPATSQLIHEHGEWGETTRNLAIAAAVLAVVGFLFKSSPLVALAFRFLVLIVALIATLSVIQTGRLGGEMVYHHAVGISQDAASQ